MENLEEFVVSVKKIQCLILLSCVIPGLTI